MPFPTGIKYFLEVECRDIKPDMSWWNPNEPSDLICEICKEDCHIPVTIGGVKQIKQCAHVFYELCLHLHINKCEGPCATCPVCETRLVPKGLADNSTFDGWLVRRTYLMPDTKDWDVVRAYVKNIRNNLRHIIAVGKQFHITLDEVLEWKSRALWWADHFEKAGNVFKRYLCLEMYTTLEHAIRLHLYGPHLLPLRNPWEDIEVFEEPHVEASPNTSTQVNTSKGSDESN